MKNRIEPTSSENVVFYPLDTSHPDKWDDIISKPAAETTSKFLAGSLTPPKLGNRNVRNNKRELMSCDKCHVTCDCEVSFEAHMSSKRHKKRLASIRKAERVGGG